MATYSESDCKARKNRNILEVGFRAFGDPRLDFRQFADAVDPVLDLLVAIKKVWCKRLQAGETFSNDDVRPGHLQSSC